MIAILRQGYKNKEFIYKHILENNRVLQKS